MGWVGEAVSFTRGHVLLHPTTHKYRRIGTIIGASHRRQTTRNAPGRARGGNAGVGGLGPGVLERAVGPMWIRKPRGRSVRAQKHGSRDIFS